ncbi:MAG: hypothetical protein R2711_12865 [Acidimicrobiales bacterium]
MGAGPARRAGHQRRPARRRRRPHGRPGPDQGYLLKLVPLLRDELVLADGEDRRDAEAGGVAIALKRASLFGRAPIVHDLRVAYTVWGLLSPSAPPSWWPSAGLASRVRLTATTTRAAGRGRRRARGHPAPGPGRGGVAPRLRLALAPRSKRSSPAAGCGRRPRRDRVESVRPGRS